MWETVYNMLLYQKNKNQHEHYSFNVVKSILRYRYVRNTLCAKRITGDFYYVFLDFPNFMY